MKLLSLKLDSYFSPSSTLLLLCLLISLLLQINQALVNLPKGVEVPAVLVFGDSIVDPGNNNYIHTMLKCDFPPYGRDFMGGQPTGRFSNGKIPSDLIAEELGIKELLPAYLDPNLKPEDLLTGVSFASGGSGYDPLTSQMARVFGLSDQLKMFQEYIRKLKAIAGEERAAKIISDSLYLVVGGSNDIASTSNLRSPKYDVQAYTDLMLQGASTFFEELYELGARRVGVFSAPPVGCVPSQRTLCGGRQRECAEDNNRAALLFNSKLSSELHRLNRELPHGRLVYIDIYNPLLDLINNPIPFGFKVVNRGCCGTGKIEVTFLCNKLSPCTCEDDSKYVFWDSYHPSQKAYEVLFRPIISNNVNSFFCHGKPC